MGVFLLPLILCLRHPVPFPRVFLQFWPVWIYLTALYADRYLKLYRSSKRKIYIIIGVLIILTALSEKLFLSTFSVYLKPASSQDDFFQPYYMTTAFQPEYIVDIIKEKNVPGPVFLSVYSDYPSIYYYSKIKHCPDSLWLFDSPSFRPDKKLKTVTVIVKNYLDMKIRMKQFNMNSYHRIAASPNQLLFVLRK
jgi:hypothetical protein